MLQGSAFKDVDDHSHEKSEFMKDPSIHMPLVPWDAFDFPVDAVVLTTEKKSRIMSLLSTIQAEYRAQAQKIEWQQQLLESKQNMIDEFKQIMENQPKHNQYNDPIRVSSPFLGKSTSSLSSNASKTEYSSMNDSKFDAHSPIHRTTQESNHRIASDKQNIVYGTNDVDIISFRKTLLHAAEVARQNSILFQELRSQSDTKQHLHDHRKNLQRVFQQDLYRSRTQNYIMLEEIDRLRFNADEQEVELNALQDDYVDLQNAYDDLLTGLNQLQQENNKLHEHNKFLEDKLESNRHEEGEIQSQLEELGQIKANPLWNQFVHNNQVMMAERNEIMLLHETTQVELNLMKKKYSECVHSRDVLQVTVSELKRLLQAQESKWSDNSNKLLQLADIQEQEITSLRVKVAELSDQNSDWRREMQQKLVEEMETKENLAKKLTAHVKDLKMANRELHRRFLECESMKISQASLQEELEKSRHQVKLAESSREEAETWQKTCIEHQQRGCEYLARIQNLEKHITQIQTMHVPDVSQFWSKDGDNNPAVCTVDEDLLRHIKDVLDARISEYQNARDKNVENPALDHYLAVETVFLSALRGRLMLLA